MPEIDSINPAEEASKVALEKMFSSIEDKRNFLLEAGAGAGKTYSLIKALQYLIEKNGVEFLRKHQSIACITYTNVASDEIRSRIDSHPVVFSSTIHAFCWSLIKDFQPELRKNLTLIESWSERITEAGGLGEKKVRYELGYPKIDGDILLGHGDVITLTIALMESKKFREIFVSRYPVVLIDEYQDTDEKFIEALKKHFFVGSLKPLIGFFGDHWQKIYEEGGEQIAHPELSVIGVEANFRSVAAIVDVLNKMRPELPQAVRDAAMLGTVGVYHTNSWTGTRQSKPHWKGDLPVEEAHNYLERLKEILVSDGWKFESGNTKVLMLTHNVLAKEQGYSGIIEAFDGKNDRFVKKEDRHIKFLVEIIEPLCLAYERRQFGEMLQVIGGKHPVIHSHADKIGWKNDIEALMTIRSSGTVGDVIDHLKSTGRPHLPESVERKESKLSLPADKLDPDELKSIESLRALRGVPYQEIVALTKFINEKTPFSTKHGVKGAEFENVLVVIGRGWNLYDFNQMLEWFHSGVPTDRLKAFYRNRNLFYVACSRARKNLALLFTQKLSENALKQLTAWFSDENIHSIS